MSHDARTTSSITHTRSTAGQQEATHARSQATAFSMNRGSALFHGIGNSQPGMNGTTRRVDDHPDSGIVNTVQIQQLGDNFMSHLVIHTTLQEDNAFFQQARRQIVSTFRAIT